MTLEQIQIWAAFIAIVAAAVGVIWRLFYPLVKKARHLLDSLSRFTVDWFGEDAAPGRDAVPGVMERLNNIDGELKHNGGSTMKDAIKRIENKLKAIDARLDEGNLRFEELENKAENNGR
jgi:hypothetical protein